jgi:hypothetical protein
MTQAQIFEQLIAEMAKKGYIEPLEMDILNNKAQELGLTKATLDLMIQMALDKNNPGNQINHNTNTNQASDSFTTKKFKKVFKSAITRFGSILTPDIIVITNDTVTYRKRNKYLLNVDSRSIPIQKISSVEIDTSLLGTDIIIKSYGAGVIKCRKFTLSDAKKIRNLIYSIIK